MGVYKNLGIRRMALNLIESINWIRLYGFQTGTNIYNRLRKKNIGLIEINNDYFKYPVYLRDNYSDAAIFRQVFYEEQYKSERLSKIDASYIIDAGANIGLASIYFSHAFPKAKILALEPQKDNFDILEKNVQAYKNVTPVHAALWGSNETISIKNPESLAASFMVDADDKSTIPALTVSYLLEKYNCRTIDVLKIDIEGAEKEVFEVNTEWLKNVNVLIIELHDHYKANATKTVFKALDAYEYDAEFFHENIFIYFKH
jgi:FkbM family methyltransferase